MEKTLSYLRRICAKKEYCRKDIFDKAFERLKSEQAKGQVQSDGHNLPESGYESAEAVLNGNEMRQLAWKAVCRMEEEGFVNESRYARAYAHDKAELNGWGPVKIACMLRGKGLPKDIIEDALKEIGEATSNEKLELILGKKVQKLQKDPLIRIKLLKFALSRGYAYECAHETISRVLAKSNEDED